MIARSPQDHRPEGERRKEAAFEHLENHRERAVLRGRRALVEAVLRHGTATADDVRRAVELPPGIDPKVFGTVPGALAKAGIIERDGFDVTSRPTAHARPISVWRLADRGAAERWLAEHPDRPDDDLLDGEQGLLFPTSPQPINDAGSTGATAEPALED